MELLCSVTWFDLMPGEDEKDDAGDKNEIRVEEFPGLSEERERMGTREVREGRGVYICM